MGQYKSKNALYAAEEIWLQSHFQDIEILDFSFEFEVQMTNSRLTLPEVLFVLQTGTVVFADRDREGCNFIIVGRNCDDDEIQICGGFSSDTQAVSLSSIEKAR